MKEKLLDSNLDGNETLARKYRFEKAKLLNAEKQRPRERERESMTIQVNEILGNNRSLERYTKRTEQQKIRDVETARLRMARFRKRKKASRRESTPVSSKKKT